MDTLIPVLFFGFVLCMLAAYVSALVSAARVEQGAWHAADRRKGVTLALIVFTGGFGGLYYWLRIRPELLDAPLPPANEPGRAPTAAELRAIEASKHIGR